MSSGYNGLPPYYVQSSDPFTPNLGLSLKGMDPILAENMVLIDNFAGGGGGTSVFVNGVSVNNPNFNNSVPAAPAGFTNVLWQKSGSSVSAYVPVSTGAVINATCEAPVSKGMAVTLDSLDNATTLCFPCDNSLPAGGIALQDGNTDDVIQVQLFGEVLVLTKGGVSAGNLIGVSSTPGVCEQISDYNVGDAVFILGVAVLGTLVDGLCLVSCIPYLKPGTVASGTVTNFSAGNLSPLFTTSVTSSSSTPDLEFALSNVAANIVFAGPTSGGAAAPSYRSLVVADIPNLPASIITSGLLALARGGTHADLSGTGGTSFVLRQSSVGADITVSQLAFSDISGVLTAAQEPATTVNAVTNDTNVTGSIATQTLTLGWTGTLAVSRGGTGTATTSQNFVFAGPTSGSGAPSFRALVSGDLPAGTGTVTSFSAGNLSPLFTTSVATSTTTPALTFALTNQNANLVYAGPTSGGAAAPTFRALVAADLPAGIITWDAIGSALGALVLNNAGFATTFNQTSSVVWKWANTAPLIGSSLNLTAAANASGGNTQYTGTITGGGSNAYAGASVAIIGFTNGNNNGTFTVVSSTTTTITVNNPNGVAETHAGTFQSSAVSNSPVHRLSTQVASGGTSIEDTWSVQVVIGAVQQNPTSTLTFTHAAGSTGVAAVSVPAGTLGTSLAYGLTFNGAAVGFTATSTVLAVQTSGINGTEIRVYGAGTNIGSLVKVDSNSQMSYGIAGATSSVWIGDISNGNRTGVGSIVSFGQSQNTQWKPTAGGPAFGVSIGGGRSVSTQGFLGFSPASGAVKGIALGIEPTVNQTGTATGDFTALHINLTNTAFLGTNLLLFDAQVGSASQFTLNSSGVATKYAAATLVSQGMPSEIVTVDLTAQSAAITATTLISAPRSGMFRISWSATITTAATTSSVLGGTNGFQAVYTSPTDSVVKTTVPGLSVTSAANTTATAVGGSIIVYAKTGTNIQYQYDYTSVGVTAMQYELHIKLEAM